MTFHQKCLDGDLSLTCIGESPMKMYFPTHFQEKILNGKLQSEWLDIAPSDWLLPQEEPVRGNMQDLYISGGKVEDTQKLFDLLSREANVTDPFTPQSIGTYGALNDKFGVRWMFHAV